MIYVFDPSTGQIKSKIKGPDSHAVHYGENAFVSSEDVLDSTHYVDVPSRLFVPIPAKTHPLATWDWEDKSWVHPSDSELTEIAERTALTKRANLLSSSDWTQLPDVPLGTKAEWATYRQALRDITAQPGYPLEIVWPVAP